MPKKIVDVAVIIPDSSPILTLSRVGRLDLFDTFTAPIVIVDQVEYEITKPTNDVQGNVSAWLKRKGNEIKIEETIVGFGFKTKLERGDNPPSGGLGEIAVDEYASRLARQASPTFVPLVLFEDPDVLETRIARLPRVHLLNTAAWLGALQDDGVVPDAKEILKKINAHRKTPMTPIERPGKTGRVRSDWIGGTKNDVS